MLHLPRFLERLFRREASYSSEPETALFKRLHLHLTFWYSAVLGGALIIFCLVIYFSVQYLLFSSVRDELATQTQIIAGPRRGSEGFCDRQQPPNLPRPGPSVRPMPPRILIACFDRNGLQLPAEKANEQSFQALIPGEFLDNSLVKSALHHGNQTDIVDTGDSYGHVYRYARVLANPETRTIDGVVLIGESITTQESALNILLIVLIGTGGLVLLGAVAGGLFLSHRAMQPARLAFTRQQNFIANASHELRTPLTFLCANTEILLEERDYLPPEDVTLLEDIQTEATHMAALANNMLTLARLDMGNKLHHEHDILDLTALAESAVRQGKALADQQSIHLQAEGPKPLYIIGDPVLLEQTILVLLENAIKYNRPNGQVILRTSQEKEVVHLEVQDTGIGIAPEHLPRLGERFYRVDKARSRAAGGTGLGLSIARGIILAHGGSLQFASQPGQGTAVKITLPAMNAPIHDKKDISQALA
jgi:signal transduction histidine kinase